MRFNTRMILALPVVAAFLTAGTSFASPITGYVYENQAPYPASLTFPTTAANATFQTTGLMFQGGQNGVAYTIGGFLNSFGDLVPGSLTGLTAGFSAGDTLNNTTFYFTGQSYFTNGQTYSVTHDDGMFLNILDSNGNTNYISSGSPTAAETSSFVFTGKSGYDTFGILYGEVNGAPAVLETSIAPTPEPSTLLMLGTGLASIGGVIRRKLKA